MPEKVFSFEPFAQHGFYQDVNRKLVSLTDLRPGQCVLDLGAGTGAVTRLLAQKVAGLATSEVIAVEPSGAALKIARRNMDDCTGLIVRCIQAGAEQFASFLERPVDAVFLCNAIHLIRDKVRVVEEVFRSLRPGGVFAFNTTFFKEGEPPESQQFYRRWLFKALRLLKSRYNLSPTAERTTARDRLSEEDYQQLVEERGFLIRIKELLKVDMPIQSFKDISAYDLWIQGVLPGVPLAIGAEVLQEAVQETFTELKLRSSPRNWLLMVAGKT